MTEAVATVPTPPSAARAADVSAKTLLILLLALALLYPESGNLRDKAAGLRAVGYPLVSFAIPLLWWATLKDRVVFPWAADVLVTVTCFTDILGNRLDLYDTVVWFDDWMHFMNTGLLAAAVVLLTMPRGSSLPRVLERSLAFGATAAIAWEIGEFFAFVQGSSERRFAYADTLGDLGLGVLGALLAGLVVHQLWRQGRLAGVEPITEQPAAARTAG
jgi:hypothetical protein